jgi:hypothetical protein
MRKSKFTYTVHTRAHGVFNVLSDKAPDIFKDDDTGENVLQFETAWFRLMDVVCFFRFTNKVKRS